MARVRGPGLLLLDQTISPGHRNVLSDLPGSKCHGGHWDWRVFAGYACLYTYPRGNVQKVEKNMVSRSEMIYKWWILIFHIMLVCRIFDNMFIIVLPC